MSDKDELTKLAEHRHDGASAARDLRGQTMSLVLLIIMVIALFSGAIVVVMAVLWQGRELPLWSMLLAWPIAAVVLSGTFAPLAFVAIRHEKPPIVLAPGERPPATSPSTAISQAAQMAPFGLAVGATIIAILFFWTSVIQY